MPYGIGKRRAKADFCLGNVEQQWTNGATPYQKNAQGGSCRPQCQTERVLFLQTIKHHCSEYRHCETRLQGPGNVYKQFKNLNGGQNQTFWQTAIEDQRSKLRILINNIEIEETVNTGADVIIISPKS